MERGEKTDLMPVNAPLVGDALDRLGRALLDGLDTLRGLGAFALITLGVIVTRLQVAGKLIHPMIRRQIQRCGLHLFPMIMVAAVALGLLVIGQTVALLSRIGAQEYIGVIMVTVVVRELGPLATAMLVLGRVGTATVIELGSARAQGEVETLEALGIDPIHFLVVPRVLGLVLGVFALTVYLILGALASGYLFAFLQDIPLRPEEYVQQLAAALGYADFVLLALKTFGFGLVIAVASCYHGLARPLTLEEVAPATIRAVVHGVIGCALIDALFVLVYLLI